MDSQTQTQTQTQGPIPSSRKRGCQSRKLSLEDYLAFVETRNLSGFTVNYLSQIIGMHGFKKSARGPKDNIIDAISTIDPLCPFRSTLEENISPCAYITLEETIENLTALNWQECCTTSIQTLGSSNHNSTCKEIISTDQSLLRNTENTKMQPLAIIDPNAASASNSASACSSGIGDHDGTVKSAKPNFPPRRKKIKS